MSRGRFDRGHAVGGCDGGTSRVSTRHCFVDGADLSRAPVPGYCFNCTSTCCLSASFRRGYRQLGCRYEHPSHNRRKSERSNNDVGVSRPFSLGGIAGAAGITILLGAGASPLTAVLCIVVGIAVALVLSASHLLPYGSKNEGPAFAIPHGIVLFIGALCFILFLTEGSLLDWSAVFLTSVRGMNVSDAGLGYAAFALTMTIGRLTGDRLVRRVGPISIVISGASARQ